MLDRIEQFIQDASGQLAALHAAATANNAMTPEQAAHTLKSSNANAGALGMAALCQELQMLNASK